MSLFDSYNADPSNLKHVMFEMSKNSNPAGAVKALNPDQLDVCMRYVYALMDEADNTQASALLKWHESAFAQGGLGTIVRALARRN